MSVASRSRWPLRLVALAIIWGLSFLLVKIGERAFAPLEVSLGRMLVGTATLLTVVVAARQQLPTNPRVWAQLAVAALLLNALPFSLIAYGERHVSSVGAVTRRRPEAQERARG